MSNGVSLHVQHQYAILRPKPYRFGLIYIHQIVKRYRVLGPNTWFAACQIAGRWCTAAITDPPLEKTVNGVVLVECGTSEGTYGTLAQF